MGTTPTDRYGCAGCLEAGGERVFKHGTGKARIASEQHDGILDPFRLQPATGGHAEAPGKAGIDERAAEFAADTVGSEKLAFHSR